MGPREFPSGPVAKTGASIAMGPGSIRGQGNKVPQTMRPT